MEVGQSRRLFGRLGLLLNLISAKMSTDAGCYRVWGVGIPIFCSGPVANDPAGLLAIVTYDFWLATEMNMSV
jgi:hypothetical protein